MKRAPALVVALVLGLVGLPASGTRAAPPPAAPTHALSVQGPSGAEGSVAMYPAYDAAIERLALTTTGATDGRVTVTASTSDPDGAVYVDGRPAPGGTRTLAGLEAGDEIAVFIVDSAGTERHSLVYLPAGFPALERTTPDPAPGALEPGVVLLTLGTDFAGIAVRYEAGVDVNGVPAFVNVATSSLDLKLQPNGRLSVSRLTDTPGRTGLAAVELDHRFREVASHESVGLTNTDGHDSIVEPDGTAWLLAEEPNPVTHRNDSVVQRVDPDGTVGFEWSTAGLEDESTVSGADYAHVNSVQVMADGDVLVSLRHFSSVYKIATTAHDGFAPREVVWRLGGRHSDFTFTGQDGEPDGGPCAQHTARELPNGHILMFDNGSVGGAFGTYCVDPEDPTGDPVVRPRTRIVEFALGDGVAQVVHEYAPQGRSAFFAGSAQHLAGGDTLVGWASDRTVLATELDPDWAKAWELRDANPDQGSRFFTYRAHKAEVPDTSAPRVEVAAPAAGASYVAGATVEASYECTDRGGSSLQACAGPALPGETLDTSTPGTHTFAVTATDGAGLSTEVTRHYTVLPDARPDATITVRGKSRVVGAGRYGPASSQQVHAGVRRNGSAAVAVVHLRNRGPVAERIAYRVRGRSRGLHVGRSGAAKRGRSPLLEPGESWTLRLKVTRRAAARRGDRVVVRVPVHSTLLPGRSDGVSFRVRAGRR